MIIKLDHVDQNYQPLTDLSLPFIDLIQLACWDDVNSKSYSFVDLMKTHNEEIS